MRSYFKPTQGRVAGFAWLLVAFFISFSVSAQETIPYTESFDSDDGGWTTSGTNSSWAWNETDAWETNPNGDYNNSELSYLTSPTFDLSANNLIRLAMNMEVVTEGCCDEVWLEVSTDGTTFSKVISEQLNYTSSSNYWNGSTSVNIDNVLLSGIGGSSTVQFRLVFDSDGSVIYSGMVLNSFSVSLPPDHDVVAVSIQNTGSSSLLGSNESVSVSFLNAGANTEISIPLTAWLDGPNGRQSMEETVTTSLASGDTLEYSFSGAFDMSTVGNYNLNIFSTVPDDAVLLNDTISSSFEHQSVYTGGIPYSEGFEVESDLTYEDNQGELDGLIGWSFVKESFGTLDVTTPFDPSEGKALILSSSTNDNQRTSAQLTMDLSAYQASTDEILLDFDFSHRYADNSSLHGVFARGSEADEWILLYDWYENRGSDYEWINVLQVPVSDSLLAHGQEYSNSFQIKFGFRQFFSNRNFYLDNVQIYERPEHDLMGLDTQTPEASSLLTSNESISVRYKNVGLNIETSIPLTAWLDGPNGRQTISETVTTSLASGDTLNYSFASDFDMSIAGNYYLTVFSELTGDTRFDSDTLKARLVHISTYSGGLPYEQDFETETAGTFSGPQFMISDFEGWSWIPSQMNGELLVTTTTNGDGKAIGLGRTSNGSNYTENPLILTLDLSAYTAISNEILLDFNYSQVSPINNSQNAVFVRGSESDNWLLLFDWYQNRAADNTWKFITSQAISDSLMAHGQDFSETFQVKFNEIEDGSYDRLYIDNVRVYERPAHDVAAYLLTAPSQSSSLSSSESVSVNYINKGFSTEISIPLTAWLDGPNGRQTVTETVTTSLVTSDTLDYTFTTGFDYSAKGVYQLTVFSGVAGDSNFSNDTLRVGSMNLSKYSGELPYNQDFESVSEINLSSADGVIEGLEGWSYTQSSENGSLKIITSEDGTNKRFSLDRTGFDSKLNHATLSMDMSAFSVATNDILMDYDFTYRLSHWAISTQISVRGSETDDWLILYQFDWGSSGTFEIWQELRNIAISDTLAANSQEFSESFQLRFQEMGRWSSNVFYLDNISIYERSAYDMFAEDIVVPASSTQLGSNESVSVSFVNLGSNQVSSVPLTAWLDGPNGRQTVSETAATSLAANDTLNYTFTAGFDLSAEGIYQLTVFSELVDEGRVENDTIQGEVFHLSSYTADLPYTQDFNSSSDTTYHSRQAILEGLPGWSFNLEDQGRLTLATPDGYVEGQTLELTRFTTRSETTSATLSLDMSAYQALSDGLLLEFDFSHINSYSNSENGVFIRGSESDSWILLYDWYENRGGNNEWIHVTSLSISDSLLAHGQDYSSSFQIKFQERHSYSSGSFFIDNIRVYARPAHELEAIEAQVPMRSSLLSADESITVSFINQGTSTETSIPLTALLDGPDGRQTVSETATTSLATSDTLNYTFTTGFDLSAEGNYRLTVFSELSEDAALDNDTLRSEAYHLSSYSGGLPYAQGFTLESDSTYSGDQAILLGLPGWSFDQQSSSRLTVGTPSGHTDGQALAFDKSNYETETSYAKLTMDLSTYSVASDDLLIGFDFSHVDADNSAINGVFVRGSESEEWILLYDWYENRAGDNEWITVSNLSLTDSLSAHSQEYSSSFQLKFQVSEYSRYDYFYLDNVEVFVRPAHEIVALDVQMPGTSSTLTANESISVRYINQGVSTETSIPLTAWLDGPEGRQTATETATTSIATNDTLNYTFTTAFDMSAEGNYDITVFSELASDAKTDNDTLRSKAYHLAAYTGELPYVQNFSLEADTVYYGNQAAIVDLPGWSYGMEEYGRLAIATPTDHLDGQALTQARTTSYTETTQVTFTMDLSSNQTSTDELLLAFDFTHVDAYDYGDQGVFVRGNESNDWILLYDWFENRAGNREWIQVTSLSVTDSLLAHGQEFSSSFQVKFQDRNWSQYDYFYVDNVQLYARPENDVLASSLTLPAGGFGLTATENISASYVNVGKTTETSVPFTAWLDGPNGRQIVEETASTSIATSETLDYSFTSDFDFSAEGNYELTVFSSLTGDAITANDTIRSQTGKTSVYRDGLPFVTDFEVSADTTYDQRMYGIPELPGWSYTNTAKEAKISVGVVDQLDGNVLALCRNNGSYRETNHAYITIDMSGYTVAQDVLLDFDFSHEYATNYSNTNGVYIRGSQADNWVLFYDWYANRGSNWEWIEVEAHSLTDTLVKHSQDFSETFQIRFSEDDYNDDGFFLDNVRVYERGEHDMVALVAPDTEGSPFYGENETVTLQWANYGASEETTIPIEAWIDGPNGRQTLNQEASTSLSTLDTLTIDLTGIDLTAGGRYDIRVFTKVTGEEYPENDTVRFVMNKHSIYSGTLPYVQDFEGLTDTTYTADQAELYELSGWNYQMAADYGQLSITESFSGGQLMSMTRSNWVSDPNDAILTMDLSQYAANEDVLLLDFDFAVTYTNSSEDNGVFIRGSANDEWILLYDWYANRSGYQEWVEVRSQLLSDSLVAHGQDFSSTFQVRFGENIRSSGFYFYLDNVKIYQRDPHEVELTSLMIPEQNRILSATESISVSILNNGASTETSIPLEAWLDGPNGRQTVIETVSTSLSYGETLDHTFTEVFDFSAGGSYQLTVFVELLDDADASNDTLRANATNISTYAGLFPYFQDFESVTDTTYTEDQGVIQDLTGWSFSTDSDGTLSIVDNLVGEGKVLNFSHTEGTISTNELIFTVDMSEYQVALNDFKMKATLLTKETNTTSIRYRGSENESWITIPMGYSKPEGDSLWHNDLTVSLSNILSENGQEFSSSTQIKFEERSDLSLGLIIKDFSLYSSPFGQGRSNAVSATLGDDAYFGLGSNASGFLADFWKTDEAGEFTELLPQFPGVSREAAVSFVLGTKIYVGTGANEAGDELADFNAYDTLTKSWSPIADFGGGTRSNAVAFVIGDYAYVGTGFDGSEETSDFWKYDPSTDTWTSVAGLGSLTRQGAFAFAIDGKAYVGGGMSVDRANFATTQHSDIQEYDPETDIWTERVFADGLNLSINNAATFVADGKGYIAYGNKDAVVTYDPSADVIDNLGDLLGLGDNRYSPIAFVLEGQPYFGFGSYGFTTTEYDDQILAFPAINYTPTALTIPEVTVEENLDIELGSFAVEDPWDEGTHTFSLVAGDGTNDFNNEDFYIIGNSLYSFSSISYEEFASVNIFVRVTDEGGKYLEQAFTFEVMDANDTPTGINLTNHVVAESTTGETIVVGTLQVEDEDATDTYTYELLTADVPFEITGDELSIVAPDYETSDSHTIEVRVTDAGGLSTSAMLTITVEDVNEQSEGITFDHTTISEGLVVDDFVGNFDYSDPDLNDTYTFALVENSEHGTDNSLFRVQGSGIYVVTPVNFEQQSSVSFFVQATDSYGQVFDLPVVLDVTDVNEAPTAVTLQLLIEPSATSLAQGEVIGQLVVEDVDVDDSFFYNINTASHAVAISSTGEVSVPNGLFLNAAGNLTFEVEVVDLGGNSIVESFTINRTELILGTGIDESLISVYPNPTQDIIVVDAKVAERLELYSLTGELMLESEMNSDSKEVSLRDLPQGVYLLKIYNGDSYLTKRVIKN